MSVIRKYVMSVQVLIWTYLEYHGTTFTQDPGRLWPHSLIIEPMHGLRYITKTQLSKRNPNEITHDDIHPIRQDLHSHPPRTADPPHSTVNTRIDLHQQSSSTGQSFLALRSTPMTRLNGVNSTTAWPADSRTHWFNDTRREKVGLHTCSTP